MESISYWTNSYHEAFSKKNINLTQIEIWKSIFERKKIGMDKLKNWDEASKTNIQMVKIFVDNMFVELDNKLNESFQRYEKIYKFFSQIRLTYVSRMKLSEDTTLFGFDSFQSNENTNKSNTANNPFSDFIKSFDDNLNSFQDKVNSYKTQIVEKINNNILTETVKLKETEIKQLFVEVKTIKAKVQKISLLTSNKLKNLSKAFKEYFVDANKTKRPIINVFEFVFSFMNHVKDLSDLIKEYGNLFVKLYQQAKELERERLEAIGESFSFFFKLTRESFCADMMSQFNTSLSLLGQINHDSLIENNYDVKKMLQPHHQELIKVTLKSDQINIDVISQFIKTSKYEESIKEIFEYFVLKIYKIEEVGSKSNKNKQMILFLTIDYFYTVYSVNEETKEYELVTRFSIEETELNFPEMNIAHFSFYERNFLWKSKKKFMCKFLVDCSEEVMLDHETFSLLLKVADITDDSQSTKVLNKSFDGTKDCDDVQSPDNSSEKVIKEDSKIEMNIQKLLTSGKSLFFPSLEKIVEEKDEEYFTDERSADVDSKFSNDDLSYKPVKSEYSIKRKKPREI